jgi:plasmid stabilization system protein ParE
MRRIILSKRASRRLEKLLEYLESEWSLKVKKEFIKKLDKSFIQIKKYPDSSPRSEIVKGLHKLVITKQTTIYYRYDSKSISIVTIFDNRMNPNKLKREVK